MQQTANWLIRFEVDLHVLRNYVGTKAYFRLISSQLFVATAFFYVNYGVRATGNNRMPCLTDSRDEIDGQRPAKPQVRNDAKADEQMLDLHCACMDLVAI